MVLKDRSDRVCCRSIAKLRSRNMAPDFLRGWMGK